MASTRPIPYADAVRQDEGELQHKLFTPAADRNKEPILQQLIRLLPKGASVLEIASGSGQHAAFFSQALRDRGSLGCWQPTDLAEAALRSIECYRSELAPDLQETLQLPQLLDVLEFLAGDGASSTPATQSLSHAAGFYDAVLAVNLIHISPKEATTGLMRCASHALKPGGLLLLYGAFKVDGKPTTESNAAFDLKLQEMDPRFGLRDLHTEVEAAAISCGLALREAVEMPSNNLFVVFEKK